MVRMLVQFDSSDVLAGIRRMAAAAKVAKKGKRAPGESAVLVVATNRMRNATMAVSTAFRGIVCKANMRAQDSARSSAVPRSRSRK